MKIIDWIMNNGHSLFIVLWLWLVLCFVVMFTAMTIYFVRMVLCCV